MKKIVLEETQLDLMYENFEQDAQKTLTTLVDQYFKREPSQWAVIHPIHEKVLEHSDFESPEDVKSCIHELLKQRLIVKVIEPTGTQLLENTDKMTLVAPHKDFQLSYYYSTNRYSKAELITMLIFQHSYDHGYKTLSRYIRETKGLFWLMIIPVTFLLSQTLIGLPTIAAVIGSLGLFVVGALGYSQQKSFNNVFLDYYLKKHRQDIFLIYLSSGMFLVPGLIIQLFKPELIASPFATLMLLFLWIYSQLASYMAAVPLMRQLKIMHPDNISEPWAINNSVIHWLASTVLLSVGFALIALLQ